jgi:hypothetical protein
MDSEPTEGKVSEMGYDFRFVRRPDGERERVEAAREVFNAACKMRDDLPKEEQGTFNFERAKEHAEDRSFDDDANYDGRSLRWQAAQAKVHEAYEAMNDAEVSYFRLNIWGMGEYCRLMDAFGMATDHGAAHPPWPEMDAYGIDDAAYEAVAYPEDAAEDAPPLDDLTRAAAERFVAAQNAVLIWHEEGSPPVIPGHKFSSNDGWIVTPDECTAAISAWKGECAEAGAGDEELGRKVLIDAMDENKMGGDYWLKWVAYIELAAQYGGFEVH